ncbi:MAG: hypothetical protein HYX91_05340 [Chloroflexi bacterium]|nr:hypothetical protein [Chloroflexota bacterium]
MKNRKSSRIVGVGLVAVLLVSLLGFALPASAGTLSWTSETIPGATNQLVVAGDVLDIAVAPDGNTIYAVAGTTTVYKSTNRGDTWSTILTTAGGNPPISPTLVAVAPDNANIVVIAVGGTPNVYASTNGGSTWGVLGVPQEAALGAAAALTDLAVSAASAGTNFIAVSGTEAGPIGNVWYFNLGAAAPVWKETNSLLGFTAADAPGGVGAVAFSPNFASDQLLAAVTFDATTDDTSFQLFSLSTKLWNTNAGFVGYPVTIANDVAGASLTAASIALAPDYLGSDDTLRVAFIGIDRDATATASLDGIYRLRDTAVKQIKDTANINSVAYNGATLVAGVTDSNAVWRSDDPLASTPTVVATTSLKRPGSSLATDVVVAWAGTDVIAGTSGDDSAFSRSADNGATFNDISLIDAALTVLTDAAVSADGSVVYLVTDDTADTSVWRKSGGVWQRVFNIQTDTGYIVRISPDDPNVVYIAKKGAQTLFYSKDGGTNRWFTRTSPSNLADLAVESTDVAYIAVDSAATVRKTTNGGFIWGTAKSTELVAGNIATIAALGNGNVIVGGTTGYVSYSTDGNSSWTKITQQIEGSALLTQVTADTLGEGGFIYAATSKVLSTVKRWPIGQAMTVPWKNLEAPTAAGHMATGIALQGGALYVITNDGTDSQLLRTLSPKFATPSAALWNAVDSLGETFAATPSALRASSGSTKLWAIDTAAASLFSYTDTLADTPPPPTGPVAGANVEFNPVSGQAFQVAFAWSRPSEATAYQLQIALDNGFTQVTGDFAIATTSSTPAAVVGPAAANLLSFNPNTTYYWRVRATTPVKSPYSEVRSFRTASLVMPIPPVLSPENGAINVPQTPGFSWGTVAGATQYEFQLAAAPHAASFQSPLATAKVAETGVRPIVKLDYDTTYFWRVRVSTPFVGDWSSIANFTVRQAPAEPPPPPVEIIQQPPPQIVLPPPPPPPPDIIIPPAPPPPAPITPAYIWAIIIIGAILVIALIVLIIRTRRPA